MASRAPVSCWGVDLVARQPAQCHLHVCWCCSKQLKPTESSTHFNINMESDKLGRSAFDLNCKTTERCVIMCGMCPSCVFAPEPPGATLRLWKASDPFRRKFIVKLVLRCSQDSEVLESLQRALSATSLNVFTYARSRRPSAAEVFPRRSADRAPDEKPHGVNLNDIWDWFDSSTDCRKTLYLYRLLSLCDSELSRMVANLTDVLLVRQKRGFLQFNGKTQIIH